MNPTLSAFCSLTEPNFLSLACCILKCLLLHYRLAHCLSDLGAKESSAYLPYRAPKFAARLPHHFTFLPRYVLCLLRIGIPFLFLRVRSAEC